jgi:membrane-anchored protein YejM (alkaline phosphatase superfamily)
MHLPTQDPRSILFITLDSCRYDTFVAAAAPRLKAVGELHRAMAPSNFTYGSHAAMFVGFTPGIASRAEPFVNPKFGKIFKIGGAGFEGKGTEFMTLSGRNIIDGLQRKGYLAIGSGAVGWFDPATETGKHLTQDFDHFFFPGNSNSLRRQLDWLGPHLDPARPVFAFLNIGETHVPYYYDGAPWDPADNPCVPFSEHNSADESRHRQKACLEFIDAQLGPLLQAFSAATTIVCADHGDCWGEDGLWEHGIHHEKVLEVPLLFRLADRSHKQGAE